MILGIKRKIKSAQTNLKYLDKPMRRVETSRNDTSNVETHRDAVLIAISGLQVAISDVATRCEVVRLLVSRCHAQKTLLNELWNVVELNKKRC